MSPELFLSGHVSKASDVYAYGILLFETLTGQRAYAGVPIPLLPHEVARQGLRPSWPANLPPGCRDLQRLAEACWAQQPQDRCAAYSKAPSTFAAYTPAIETQRCLCRRLACP
jgi:serine/threonine protein kinase